MYRHSLLDCEKSAPSAMGFMAIGRCLTYFTGRWPNRTERQLFAQSKSLMAFQGILISFEIEFDQVLFWALPAKLFEHALCFCFSYAQLELYKLGSPGGHYSSTLAKGQSLPPLVAGTTRLKYPVVMTLLWSDYNETN